MSVKELIEALSAFPQDARVAYVWDGAARANAEVCYLSKGGDVLLASEGDVLYDDCDRPVGAPTENEDRYWRICAAI